MTWSVVRPGRCDLPDEMELIPCSKLVRFVYPDRVRPAANTRDKLLQIIFLQMCTHR